jgi:hypothetical protein
MCCALLTAHVVHGALVGGQQLPLGIKQEVEHCVVVAHLHQPQLLRRILLTNWGRLQAVAVAAQIRQWQAGVWRR